MKKKGLVPVQNLAVDKRTQITYQTAVYVNLIQGSLQASTDLNKRKPTRKGNYRAKTKKLINQDNDENEREEKKLIDQEVENFDFEKAVDPNIEYLKQVVEDEKK